VPPNESTRGTSVSDGNHERDLARRQLAVDVEAVLLRASSSLRHEVGLEKAFAYQARTARASTDAPAG